MSDPHAFQDTQWLLCVTHALGFDDLEIYFEDSVSAASITKVESGDIELVRLDPVVPTKA